MNVRYGLLACVLVAASGCESMRVNEGRITSVMAAAQVGMFHRQTGRWPQSKSQLVERGCKELDESRFEDADIWGEPPPAPVTQGCQFFVNLPYQLELQPVAADLRMVLRDPAGKLVCRLRVLAPAHDGHDALAPQITLKIIWPGCPGQEKSQ